MRLTTVATLYLVLMCACAMSNRPPRNENIIQTTICALTERPQDFNNKIISVAAAVSSDGLEHTSLIDSRCPNTGVIPIIPAGLEDDREVVRLNHALSMPRPGTRGKEIQGVFTGIFRWRDRNSTRILELRTISDLSVRIFDVVPVVPVVPPPVGEGPSEGVVGNTN